MSGIGKSLGKIAAVVLGVAAVVFTAGAALGAIPLLGGATSVAGAFGGAVSSGLAAIGIGTDTALGSILAGAVTSAGIGSAVGGLGAAVTGGNIIKGMETGAETGAITGGLTSGFSALTAPDISPVTITPSPTNVTEGLAANGYVAPGAASAGAAGASDLTGATIAASSPITSAPLPPAVSPSAATTGAASPAVAPAATAANPVSDVTAASTGAAGVTAPSATVMPAAATDSGGGLLSNIFKPGGMLGNGGAGYALSGIGGALISGQTAADTAKSESKLASDARAATAANYAAPTDANGNPIGSGGLLTQVAQPKGLQTPQQAFNPTARWVYDPGQKKLVLVNTPAPVSA